MENTAVEQYVMLKRMQLQLGQLQNEPTNEALYQRAKAEQRAKNWGNAKRLWIEFQKSNENNHRVHSRAAGLPDRSAVYLKSCLKRVDDENYDPDSAGSNE